MGTALWIVQGVLAVAFTGSGSMKLLKSHDALKADPKMGWANDFSSGFVKFIGAAETAGALGLVLPGLTGVASILTPLAGLGLVGVMLGAAATHLRRSETPMVFPPLTLAALAAFVAYGRFVVVPF
ncbi:MAG: DoxX family protein [Gemmatimonadales bacterium]